MSTGNTSRSALPHIILELHDNTQEHTVDHPAGGLTAEKCYINIFSRWAKWPVSQILDTNGHLLPQFMPYRRSRTDGTFSLALSYMAAYEAGKTEKHGHDFLHPSDVLADSQGKVKAEYKVDQNATNCHFRPLVTYRRALARGAIPEEQKLQSLRSEDPCSRLFAAGSLKRKYHLCSWYDPDGTFNPMKTLGEALLDGLYQLPQWKRPPNRMTMDSLYFGSDDQSSGSSISYPSVITDASFLHYWEHRFMFTEDPGCGDDV